MIFKFHLSLIVLQRHYLILQLLLVCLHITHLVSQLLIFTDLSLDILLKVIVIL